MWYFAQQVSKKPLFWGVHPKIDLFIFGAAGAEENFFGAAPSPPPGGGGGQPAHFQPAPIFQPSPATPPGGVVQRSMVDIHTSPRVVDPPGKLSFRLVLPNLPPSKLSP